VRPIEQVTFNPPTPVRGIAPWARMRSSV